MALPSDGRTPAEFTPDEAETYIRSLGVRERTLRRLLAGGKGAARLERGLYRREVLEPTPAPREFARRVADTYRDELGRVYLFDGGGGGGAERGMVDVYVQMPPRRRERADGALPLPYAEHERLHGVELPAPGDALQLLNRANGTLRTARVYSVHFERRRRIGRATLADVAEWGKISDPSEFGQK